MQSLDSMAAEAVPFSLANVNALSPELPGLTNEQWSSLLKILNNQAVFDKLFGKINDTWIFFGDVSIT